MKERGEIVDERDYKIADSDKGVLNKRELDESQDTSHEV